MVDLPLTAGTSQKRKHPDEATVFSNNSVAKINRVEPGEDGDEDESNEDDESHSEKLEQYPSHAAYDKELVRVVQEVIRPVAKALLEILDSDPCKTPDVERLRSLVRDILEVPECEKQTVALLGEVGIGKSSTVNSLLDIPKLAKAVGNGKSVTLAPMRYEKAPPDQARDFSASIVFHNTAAIRGLLTEATTDWHDYHSPRSDNVNKDIDSVDDKSKAISAVTLFSTCLHFLEDFKTEDKTHETLAAICKSEGGLQEQLTTYIERLTTYIEQLEGFRNDRISSDDSELYHEVSTSTELREWLDRHLTDQPLGESFALSPVVKKVIIRLRGPRLLDFWTVIDLPGLNDSYKLRVDSTNEYISECDHLALVDSLGRISSKPFVSHSLREYGHDFKDHISVIATMCDTGLDDELVKDLAESDPQLKQKENIWKAAKVGLPRLKKEISEAEIYNARRSIDSKWWGKIAGLRNQKIVTDVRKACKAELPAGVELPVFCISNKHYEAHRKGDFSDLPYMLHVKKTGIPELRSHLLSHAAPRQQQNMLNYMVHRCKEMLNDCTLFAQDRLCMKTPDFISITTTQTEIPGMFAKYKDTVYSDARRKILDPLRANHCGIATAAKKIVQEDLHTLHYPTIGFHVRRHGNHGAFKEQKSWNALFAKEMCSIFDEQWDAFLKHATKSALSDLKKRVIAKAEALMPQLDGQTDVANSLEAFVQTLRTQIGGVSNEFDKTTKKLNKELGRVRRKLKTGTTTNYFAKAMLPVYEECEKYKGAGVRNKVLDVLENYLVQEGSESPFSMTVATLETNIENEIKNQSDKLEREVLNIFEKLKRSFEIMMREKNTNDSEAGLREKVDGFLRTEDANLKQVDQIEKRLRATYPWDFPQE